MDKNVGSELDVIAMFRKNREIMGGGINSINDLGVENDGEESGRLSLENKIADSTSVDVIRQIRLNKYGPPTAGLTRKSETRTSRAIGTHKQAMCKFEATGKLSSFKDILKSKVMDDTSSDINIIKYVVKIKEQLTKQLDVVNDIEQIISRGGEVTEQDITVFIDLCKNYLTKKEYDTLVASLASEEKEQDKEVRIEEPETEAPVEIIEPEIPEEVEV